MPNGAPTSTLVRTVQLDDTSRKAQLDAAERTPAERSSSWTTDYTAEGDVFWHNYATGESSWYPPEAAAEEEAGAEAAGAEAAGAAAGCPPDSLPDEALEETDEPADMAAAFDQALKHNFASGGGASERKEETLAPSASQPQAAAPASDAAKPPAATARAMLGRVSDDAGAADPLDVALDRAMVARGAQRRAAARRRVARLRAGRAAAAARAVEVDCCACK